MNEGTGCAAGFRVAYLAILTGEESTTKNAKDSKERKAEEFHAETGMRDFTPMREGETEEH